MRCKGEGMGVSGGQRGKSSLTGAMVRYGHIDANALWPRPSCRGCRQKPANVSSSKTHKSQEPCLMAHQHRQKASGHLDGCDLVLCKLAFWGLFTQLVHCEIMWSYELKLENHLNLTIVFTWRQNDQLTGKKSIPHLSNTGVYTGTDHLSFNII